MTKANQFRSLIAASGQAPVAESSLAVVPRITAASTRKRWQTNRARLCTGWHLSPKDTSQQSESRTHPGRQR